IDAPVEEARALEEIGNSHLHDGHPAQAAAPPARGTSDLSAHRNPRQSPHREHPAPPPALIHPPPPTNPKPHRAATQLAPDRWALRSSWSARCTTDGSKLWSPPITAGTRAPKPQSAITLCDQVAWTLAELCQTVHR